MISGKRSQDGLHVFNTALSVTENEDHTICLDLYSLNSLVDSECSDLNPYVTEIYGIDEMCYPVSLQLVPGLRGVPLKLIC